MSRGVPLPAGPVHAVDEYLHVARALGAAIEPSTPLPVTAEARASIDVLLDAHRVPRHTPLIVVNPSASRPWKNWPAAHWIQVVDAMSAFGTVVLVGSEAQARAHGDEHRRGRAAGRSI